MTSSPEYQRSNGLAEKLVQTLKKLLSKSLKSGSDANLVILRYRNTPIGNEGSPAQLLMDRRLRETLPVLETQYLPRTIHPSVVKKKQKERQDRQKYYYDCGCRPLRPIHDDDSIHFKKGNVWKPGTVRNKQTTPHSFDIKDEHGHIFRRNRERIYKPAFDPIIPPNEDPENIIEQQTSATTASNQQASLTAVSRYGRPLRPPKFFSHNFVSNTL